MKLQIVLLSLVAVAFAEQNVYCGRRLSMALAMLCDYGDEKRGGDGGLWAWMNRISGYPWQEDSSPDAVPWLAPHRAQAVSRGKRQIVSECCMKPCSKNELIAYC